MLVVEFVLAGRRKDRYGLSWQVVPSALSGWFAGPNGQQVMETFMPMKKLLIAPLEAAAQGH